MPYLDVVRTILQTIAIFESSTLYFVKNRFLTRLQFSKALGSDFPNDQFLVHFIKYAVHLIVLTFHVLVY